MLAFFRTIFFEPLYNLLVWFSAILPGHNLGLSIILLTLVIKTILLPLQHRVTRTQRKLKEIESEIAAIKTKHAKDNPAQAQAIMELYRAHGINPFAGFVVVLIQLPILIALFYVFRDSVALKPEWLYSFVEAPSYINHIFLGFVDLTARSLPLGLLAGVTQYLQISLSMPPQAPKPQDGKPPSLRDDLARSMNLQMRYFFPVMIVFLSLGFPAAVVLYWVTSNLFSIGHELLVRRKTKAL